MPVFKERIVLANIPVKAAMRRNVHRAAGDLSIGACIRKMIKFKSNAALVEGQAGEPVGVVSKTDIVGAYYAGLPLETPLADIAARPVRLCYPDDRLEEVLDLLQRHGIHRIFVRGLDSAEIIGTLAYADVVGLLYRYCRDCPQSSHRTVAESAAESLQRTVADVMTPGVTACRPGDSIARVIEVLSDTHRGAVLVSADKHMPLGLISKTDLIVGYVHGVAVVSPAESIMSRPVAACAANALLSDAIKQMLVRGIQRLFVSAVGAEPIIGVLSLSDAARFRSGTCRACTASRILNGT